MILHEAKNDQANSGGKFLALELIPHNFGSFSDTYGSVFPMSFWSPPETCVFSDIDEDDLDEDDFDDMEEEDFDDDEDDFDEDEDDDDDYDDDDDDEDDDYDYSEDDDFEYDDE